ncbi:MAG TPA: L,D-transpeptidase, partial [Longimicrobium sp.]|nr:L,D-transpeptidase [Longimicrobium sp.]
QPALLDAVPDDRPDARIPPGPNNRVGAVWMSLSAPHYGIHGTNRPEAIGYASSAGCVRLTNWDVLFLADRVKKGITVRFTDIQGRTGAQDASGNGSRVDSAAKAAGRGTR